MKNFFSYFLLFFGEIIIISAFCYFGQNLDGDILVLNIVVSSVIYLLFFYDLIIPLADFSDASMKKIGGIGIRWFFVIVYAVLAVAAMVMLNQKKLIPLISN